MDKKQLKRIENKVQELGDLVGENGLAHVLYVQTRPPKNGVPGRGCVNTNLSAKDVERAMLNVAAGLRKEANRLTLGDHITEEKDAISTDTSGEFS